VASKGQPMSVSFDPHVPIVLFASEAEALNVPIGNMLNTTTKQRCLPLRIDLDGSGEIVRLGKKRQLMEGRFSGRKISGNSTSRDHNLIIRSNSCNSKDSISVFDGGNSTISSLHDDSLVCLLLPCQVEIRSYILDSNAEQSSSQLMSRCIPIRVSMASYDPYADLVLNDLDSTPAVIDAIDKGRHAYI